MSKQTENKPLTDKQKRFCDEYVLDFNATQAAIRAGYSEKSAREIACRLLTNVDVQKRIEERKAALDAQLENKYLISKARLLDQYAYSGFSDLRGFFNADGTMKPITELSDEQAACLASIEVHEQFTYVDGQKAPNGVIKKIKVWDKLRALEGIRKIMGYDAPVKQEVTGADGKPIAVSPAIDYSKLSDEVLLQIINARKSDG
ncbi:hypothetical protein GCM10027275_16620 [Rhabdobacter roseus]|uniref:Phage terminase small subunit n=1 Tax=Rhabdobacter roseus TaxID=1655419 RepID=A0A840TQR7_9BACT|nr:terminase small subunit [Rhabdobacter roseus]MBB5283583.1 phage terminase small subunit [Rhabdobacter roseus]